MNIFLSLVLALAFACLQSSATAAWDKPNIVFLLTDDQGYGDMGAHGHPILKTPNMDRLHAESVRMTDFSVSSSCSPTRAALMTGMQECNSGVTHTSHSRRMPDIRLTLLPGILRDAGYATGLFGKWHLGHKGEYRAENRGFDLALTCPEDSQAFHYDPELLRNGKPETGKGYRTDIFYNEAMRWISERADNKEPFFCYIPTYNAHKPVIVPDKYSAPYRGKVNEDTANFFGMLANLDENIGRLLDFLDESGLEKDTVVLFMNDNGGTLGIDTYNAGMRGNKGTIWRGGTRAFSFWRWPGTWAARDDDALSAHVDVLPTFAALAGATVPSAQAERLEGISLAARLGDPQAPWPDRMLFQQVTRWGHGMADAHKYVNAGVRWRNWNLLRSGRCEPECNGQCALYRKAIGEQEPLAYTRRPLFNYAHTPRDKWMLFHLPTDPAQENNLAESYPKIAARMAEAYDTWWDKVRPLMINEKQ